MNVLNIEEILRYIQAQGRSVEFDELLSHFEARTNNDRHHIRTKVCRLVKQRFIIKTGPNSWRAAVV